MIRLHSGTVGARFTILYAVGFVVSGIGLLGLTFLLSGGSSRTSVAPAGSPPAEGSLAAAQQHIRGLQDQLAAVHTQQARQLLAGSLVALIVMAVVSLLLGRVLARRVLRPLRLITSATRRISADNLDRRLAVTGPSDEVKDLADTVDELLERLEASFAAQRRFVANASHELRTPLATMRASLDVAVAKPDPAASTVALADRLRTQLNRVDHLLDGFLVLTRAQHGALADAAPVDLGDLVGTALREMSADAQGKGLTVTMDVPPATATQGSPALLARLGVVYRGRTQVADGLSFLKRDGRDAGRLDVARCGVGRARADAFDIARRPPTVWSGPGGARRPPRAASAMTPRAVWYTQTYPTTTCRASRDRVRCMPRPGQRAGHRRAPVPAARRCPCGCPGRRAGTCRSSRPSRLPAWPDPAGRADRCRGRGPTRAVRPRRARRAARS